MTQLNPRAWDEMIERVIDIDAVAERANRQRPRAADCEKCLSNRRAARMVGTPKKAGFQNLRAGKDRVAGAMAMSRHLSYVCGGIFLYRVLVALRAAFSLAQSREIKVLSVRMR